MPRFPISSHCSNAVYTNYDVPTMNERNQEFSRVFDPYVQGGEIRTGRFQKQKKSGTELSRIEQDIQQQRLRDQHAKKTFEHLTDHYLNDFVPEFRRGSGKGYAGLSTTAPSVAFENQPKVSMNTLDYILYETYKTER